MNGRASLRWAIMAMASSACMCLPTLAPASPFRGLPGPTLTSEFAAAGLVLFGIDSNAKPAANAVLAEGTTDLKIEEVLKKHVILGQRKVLTLSCWKLISRWPGQLTGIVMWEQVRRPVMWF